MAVYTVIDRDELETFIAPFGIGPLIDYEGVAAGIENTNYFLSTDQSDFASELHTEPTREFVLTIFESIEVDELRFYVELTTLLSLRGLPVPCPYKDADGIAIHQLHGKPAILIPKFAGQHPIKPTQQQCLAIGETLEAAVLTARKGLFDRGEPDWLCRTSRSLQRRCRTTVRPPVDSSTWYSGSVARKPVWIVVRARCLRAQSRRVRRGRCRPVCRRGTDRPEERTGPGW